MLLDALACATERRYVVLWWGGGTAGEVFWSDGVHTTTGAAPAWTALTRHNVMCHVIFGAYELEDDPAFPTWDPPHRLVADRRAATLDVGLADDVAMLLAAEPALAPRTAGPRDAAAAPGAGVLDALRAWLDATLNWVDTGAGTLAPAPAAAAGAPGA
jgi:hypothetical protein